MLQFLRELRSITKALDPVAKEDRSIHLILGGYSYGSLIASHVPTLDAMLDLFGPGNSADTPVYQISRAARRIAAQSMPDLQSADLGSRADDRERSSVSTTISYLLVSPLLPPVSQFLTVFSTLSVSVGGRSSQARPVTRPADQLRTHRTLALFGNQDTFTSARKLQRWSAELGGVPHSQFRGCEIEDAGHFWTEEGVEKHARRALQEWLGRDSS